MLFNNYIPHKPPLNKNFYLWYKTYYNYLIDLFNITNESLNKRYEKHAKLINFNTFCKFIYNTSSKHIYK